MRHDKLYSFINIIGLSVGIAGFLLIGLHIRNEMSYDRFHKNYDNICRVYSIDDRPSGRVTSAATPHALPKALANDYPNLVNVVSILWAQEIGVRVEDRIFQEKVLAASSNFFTTFNFPFVLGSAAKLSENIQSVIITKRLASKLFGQNSPLGKTITIHDQLEFIVAGVIENVPSNSSFQFDVYIPNDFVYKTLIPDEEAKWYSVGVETYIEFPHGLSPATLQAQFPNFLKKYLPDYMQGHLSLGLEPLKDIHTNTQIISNYFPASSKLMLGLLFLIACAILGIACINFINLTTARYSERYKEIGVRKVVGAGRWQLVEQFLSESMLLTFCAFIVGFALAQWMLPFFNEYVHRQLTIDPINDGALFVLIAGFVVLLGIINGWYPAFLLSGYKPVSVLKNDQKKIFGRMHTRHVLITFQYGITIVLIFCFITITNQIIYMKNHDLGFCSENLVVIPTNTHPTEDANPQKVELFTKMLQNDGRVHGVISASYSENVPGANFPNQFGLIPEGGSENDRIEMVITRSLNEDFIKTYQMNIKQGSNFSRTTSMDAIINETAAKKFGWKNPVGRRFRFAFSKELFTVIGVIRDIHFRSLQNTIEPLIFIQCWGHPNFITARIQHGAMQNGLTYLKEEWQKMFPAFPFEYHFVNDLYQNSYKEEERLLKVISIFCVLAVGLASLGLLALSALLAMQRTKEIGIRKALGASIANILFMLSRDFIQWVVAANLIAWPIAYYAMSKWLQNFPYRINLTIWTFLLSGLLAILIALLTVSWQAIQAARANPVDSLRYE